MFPWHTAYSLYMRVPPHGPHARSPLCASLHICALGALLWLWLLTCLMFRSLLNSPGSLQEMKMIKTAKKRRTKAALRVETLAMTRETRLQTCRKPAKGWGCVDGFLVSSWPLRRHFSLAQCPWLSVNTIRLVTHSQSLKEWSDV